MTTAERWIVLGIFVGLALCVAQVVTYTRLRALEVETAQALWASEELAQARHEELVARLVGIGGWRAEYRAHNEATQEALQKRAKVAERSGK